MSAQPSPDTSTKGYEIAAGGLVWRYDYAERLLAVVFRQTHQDWVLPKGRPKVNETPEATALREAMEETRARASLEKFAGSYSYFKDGRPKIVLIWHMIHEPVAYEHAAPKTEIEQVVWLSPESALATLSHESEREFVERHGKHRLPPPPDEMVVSEPKRVRLCAAIRSSRWKLQARISRSKLDPDTWWVSCVRNALALSERNLIRGDLHGGWGALHDAERFMVFGMTDAELVGCAARLRAETERKLKKNWRGSSTDALFAPFHLTEWLKTGAPLKDEVRTLLTQAIVESLGLLNEHSDTLYHRMDLVEQQLSYLVKVCGFLLILGYVSSIVWAKQDSPLGLGSLIAVSLAGALGGVVSAMYQLSRVGEAKIPEALLHGLITTGRPLVGAASALFFYFVINSNLINIIDPAKVTLLTALVLGFVAGFSEQFVLKTVGKVAGAEKDEPAPGGRSGRKIKDSADERESGASDAEKTRHVPPLGQGKGGKPSNQKTSDPHDPNKPKPDE